MRKALISALILLPMLQACAPFVGGRPIVTAQSAGCSSLVPEEWRRPVDGADLPPAEATVGDWITFGDQQTGRLDMASDRTAATIGIVERCEARDQAAVRQATRRRVLGIF